MNAFSQLKKRNILFIAALFCMIMAGSISALAVPPTQVFLTLEAVNLTGKCCFNWPDKIKLTQPTAVAPVVVTWSAEYRTGNAFIVGLTVNNGPCTAFGPRTMDVFAPSDGSGTTKAFQWVVPPSVMVKGVNTFQVCGGGALHNDDLILLGIRTLSARLGK